MQTDLFLESLNHISAKHIREADLFSRGQISRKPAMMRLAHAVTTAVLLVGMVGAFLWVNALRQWGSSGRDSDQAPPGPSAGPTAAPPLAATPTPSPSPAPTAAPSPAPSPSPVPSPSPTPAPVSQPEADPDSGGGEEAADGEEVQPAQSEPSMTPEEALWERLNQQAQEILDREMNPTPRPENGQQDWAWNGDDPETKEDEEP